MLPVVALASLSAWTLALAPSLPRLLPFALVSPLPHDASAEGHHVDELLRYLTISTAACFGVLMSILLVALVFHRGRGRIARYTHGTRRRDRLAAVIAGAVVLFGIDAVALVRSSSALRASFWRYPDGDPLAFRVEVTGQQWAWNFRYPGADGVFNTPDDIVTLNDLRVPVDRPVYLQLTSKDVVHSLYLPNFRTKIDAIPGMTTRLWFQATEPGRYEIACAQFCGVNHYKMRGLLIARPEPDYRGWLARAETDSRLRSDETAVAGAWDWETGK